MILNTCRKTIVGSICETVFVGQFVSSSTGICEIISNGREGLAMVSLDGEGGRTSRWVRPPPRPPKHASLAQSVERRNHNPRLS
jgi:hypothetical protein